MLDGSGSNTFRLRLLVWTIGTSRVLVSGFTKAGPFSFAAEPTGTGLTEAFTFPLTDIPIAITVRSETDIIQIDQTYCNLEIQINETTAYRLAGGYISSQFGLSWPEGINTSPLDGKGLSISIAGANPAAGDEISEDVGTGKLWALRSIAFSLVADGTAANRRVFLTIVRANGTVYKVPAPAVQTASTTILYVFGLALPSVNDATSLVQTAPLPDGILLNDSDTIATETTNIQSGDNFGAPVLDVEQWLQAAD